MTEEESPEEQNLRMAMALLDNDESVLGEILRLYGPDVIEVLHNRFTTKGEGDGSRFHVKSHFTRSDSWIVGGFNCCQETTTPVPFSSPNRFSILDFGLRTEATA